MKYFSTRTPGQKVSFKEALFQGLAPDGGLYLPERIPRLEPGFLSAMGGMERSELFFHLGSVLFGSDIPSSVLRLLLDKALPFPMPLVLSEKPNHPHLLELFHGPTFAFKDVGAGVMAQLMQFFNDRPRLILTATSGDTGAAIAGAFSGLPDFQVVVLYPKGKISTYQQQQLLCWDENILPVAVEGTFDDCQALAKESFLDTSAPWRPRLTSANSINVGRLLPQVFYYFEAYRQLNQPEKDLVFAVPCGNLGNLTAGVMAQRMGLPLRGFLAANNQNHVFADYLESGVFSQIAATPTLANAMDVGNPSNFERLKHLLGSTWNQDPSSGWIKGGCFSDGKIAHALNEVIPPSLRASVCPHTATAYLLALEFLAKAPAREGEQNEPGVVVFGTAHPGKFLEQMAVAGVQVDGIKAPLLRAGMEAGGELDVVSISADYKALKSFLLGLYV